jgi:flagellar basal-body rod protein FlgB
VRCGQGAAGGRPTLPARIAERWRQLPASARISTGITPQFILRRSPAGAGTARALRQYRIELEAVPDTMMIDRIDREIGSQRTALNLRSYRQELLASNIANADTPHFKARDLDFKAALGAALGARGAAAGGQLALAQTRAGHLAAEGGAAAGAGVQYRAEYQGAVDGNTVNMDVERAAFAENALQLEALIGFINHRFRSMQSAIQGQ